MSEEKMEELSKKIAREERYIKASRGDKSEVVLELIQENKEVGELSDHDINQICYRTKRYFEKEVQPELDKELEKQILRLKKQGRSKSAVKGMLKLSDTRINKFWYA